MPPSDAFERASLTLWLVAARFLDSECCDDDDGVIEEARSELHGAAGKTKSQVKSDADMAAFLAQRADELRKLNPVYPGVIAAETHLRNQAASGRPGIADGPAFDSGGTERHYGILELAGLIEARVRGLFDKFGVSIGERCHIVYATKLKANASHFGGFRIAGAATITKSPRIVYLTIKKEALSARDLMDLSYTLHHELICHAFQGAFSQDRVENAGADCHWAEGWMDTLAYDRATEWLSHGPVDWLPLSGRSERPNGGFHEARYVTPLGLTDEAISRSGRSQDCVSSIENDLESRIRTFDT